MGGHNVAKPSNLELVTAIGTGKMDTPVILPAPRRNIATVSGLTGYRAGDPRRIIISRLMAKDFLVSYKVTVKQKVR
jgi:hypothetical protein